MVGYKVKWKGEIHHKVLQSSIFHPKKITILKQLQIITTTFHNQSDIKQVDSYFGTKSMFLIEIFS